MQWKLTVLKFYQALLKKIKKLLSSYYEQSIKYMISIIPSISQYVRVLRTSFKKKISIKNFNWVLNSRGSSYYKRTTNFWRFAQILSHFYVFWKNLYSQIRHCSLESLFLQLACIWEIKKCTSISTLSINDIYKEPGSSKWKGERLLSLFLLQKITFQFTIYISRNIYQWLKIICLYTLYF